MLQARTRTAMPLSRLRSTPSHAPPRLVCGTSDVDARNKSGHGGAPRCCVSARVAVVAAFASVAAYSWLITPADAHGFGQRYDLPIPLSFYLFGTAAAVVLTFIIVALLIREHPRAHARVHFDLLATSFGRLIAGPFPVAALKFFGLIAFLVTIAAGFLGDQNPYKNIAPTMVWIIGWVGVAYVSAFVGDIWAVANPWRTLFALAAYVARAFTGRAEVFLNLRYPAALGVWPAFLLLLALSWVELVHPNPGGPALPRFPGGRLLAAHACRHVPVRPRNMAAARRSVFSCIRYLRAFCAARGEHGIAAAIAAAAVRRRPSRQPCSLDVHDGFRAAVLATVLYDGALATPEWGRLESMLAPYFSLFGDLKLMALRTAGLLVFWLIFFTAYVWVSGLMSLTIAGALSTLGLARSFALTLVPIAIGYHLAHYLTFLLIQGQYIIPLVSDPFGYGWDLFGTAGYRVDIAHRRCARLPGTRRSLPSSSGHIAAVYLAHRKAMRFSRCRALGVALRRCRSPR